MSKRSVVIVFPVYNDWDSVRVLLEQLSRALEPIREHYLVHALIVDDGSTEPAPRAWADSSIALESTVIRKPINGGHQRAILTGINFALQKTDAVFIVVMDSDGEDPPDAVPMLLKKIVESPNQVLVASRGKRFESPRFKFFYWIHRVFFRVVTGKTLDYGNFIAVSRARALELVALPEAGNHVGSALLKSGIPLSRVRVDRGRRYQGRSKMSFESLVTHSLSALSNFSERIFVRLLIAASLATALTVPLGIGVVVWRFVNEQVTPGWATTALGFLVLVTIQVWTFLGLGTMFTMNQRAKQNGESLQDSELANLAVRKIVSPGKGTHAQ